MPTFKPSIILCSLILSTLQDPWPSLPPSPGILAHGYLTGTHQLLHCVIWLCTHKQPENSRVGWGLTEHLSQTSIGCTNPLHSTPGALHLAWGLAWVTSSINGSPLICAQSQGHLSHSGSTASNGKGFCQNELKTLLCNFFLVLCWLSHASHAG